MCRGQMAQLTDRRGGQASSGRVLRHSVTQFCRATLNKAQVEATHDRTVLGDEYVVRAAACLLLGQQGMVSLGEVFVVLIASVGDRCSEVAAVRQLEVQHRRGVVSTQTLQLGHNWTIFAGRVSSGFVEGLSVSL